MKYEINEIQNMNEIIIYDAISKYSSAIVLFDF